jgi:hypothetical protein
MARGGKRPGAGRKAGVLNKRTQEIAAAATKSGKTPLEVMLDNMHFAMDEAGKALEKILNADQKDMDDFKALVRLRMIAQECAKDAAPYIHPKLANIEHSGNQDAPIKTVLELAWAGSNG